ncbi:MAG: hypothetical protein HN509_10710 [Halobacteriovoraceae bacterium]|nr:hypothetical protein [Halobacteriovoraceae bacterium]MBT5096167.1 hypothetical protein [Halobacteriovoraceae bacterium]
MACLLIFFSLSARAVSLREIQDVRLAKAELAQSDGNTKVALKLISKNLDRKNFHLDSYLFLAKYHLRIGNIPKGLRVYYFAIKRLHGKDIINIKIKGSIFKYLSQIEPPSREALKLYYTIAQTYFNIFEEGIYADKFGHQLLRLAHKYFQVCSYYRYSLPSTKLYIAQVRSHQDKHLSAVEYLIEAQDLFRELGEAENKSSLNKIDVLLGESLIKDGQAESGLIFLKGIYLDPKANSSLKQYANAYIDALATSYLAASFSFNRKLNTNIHELSNFDLNQEFDSDTFIEKEAWVDSKNFNLFYNTSKWNNFSSVMVLNILDETTTNRDLRAKDLRSYSFGLDLKYDNLKKSLFKLKYSYNQLYLKDSAAGKLAKVSTSHNLTPQYIYTLKRGTLTYGIPVTSTYSGSQHAQTSEGFSVSYTPFWHNKYLSPTFSFDYIREDEEDDSPDSNQFVLSISNHSAISDRHSFFTTFTFVANNNREDTTAYKESNLNWSYNYLVPWVKNLSLNATYDYRYRDNHVETATVVTLYSGGISYTF